MRRCTRPGGRGEAAQFSRGQRQPTGQAGCLSLPRPTNGRSRGAICSRAPNTLTEMCFIRSSTERSDLLILRRLNLTQSSVEWRLLRSLTPSAGVERRLPTPKPPPPSPPCPTCLAARRPPARPRRRRIQRAGRGRRPPNPIGAAARSTDRHHRRRAARRPTSRALRPPRARRLFPRNATPPRQRRAAPWPRACRHTSRPLRARRPPHRAVPRLSIL